MILYNKNKKLYSLQHYLTLHYIIVTTQHPSIEVTIQR